jgi:hypothetical protein
LCYVRRATTNAGFEGGAVKIEAVGLSGYATVTDFPSDSADRQMAFDLDDQTLRERLPSCPE